MTSTGSIYADAPVWAGIGETARHCGLSVATIRRRIRDGSLTAYRFGGKLRLDLRAVDQAIRQ
jgi:excisionase family DNA binding protein